MDLSLKPGIYSDLAAPSVSGLPKLLIVDSGVGGLSLVDEVMRGFRRLDISYVMDEAFFPYGPRPASSIQKRSLRLIQHCVDVLSPDVVVIACNTISTLALDLLRSNILVPIVGVVPALKVASELSKTGVVGVLATEATLQSTYFEALRVEVCPDLHVIKIPSPGLVKFADQYARGSVRDYLALERHLAWAGDYDLVGKMDQLVFGCTHFSPITGLVRKFLPLAVNIIDPVPAVMKRLEAVLSQRGYGNSKEGDVQINLSILTTSGTALPLSWPILKMPNWRTAKVKFGTLAL